MSPRTLRLRRSPRNHFLKFGAELLPELLYQIFALLAPTPSTLTGEESPDLWQMPVEQANLARSMLVCKAWCSAIERALYRTVSLRFPKTCRQFARTLKRRLALGSLVRAIYFPCELLPVGEPIHHRLLRDKGRISRFFCKLNRQKLVQAVHSILDICIHVDVVDFHAGMEIFRSYQHRSMIQSRIRACTVKVQIAPMAPSPAYYPCYYTQEWSQAVLFNLVSPENSRWGQLEVLRVHGYGSPTRMRHLLPVVLNQPPDIRGCFPNLRVLVLRDVLVNREQLETVVLALAPVLRTLGLIRTALCDGLPTWGRGSRYHPLAILDSLPDNMLCKVEDIRVDYCTSYERWPDCSWERALTRWRSLTRLSLGVEVLRFFKFVPPTLNSITVYMVRPDGYIAQPLQSLLATVNHLVVAMPTWKATAPDLRQLNLEAHDGPLTELPRWNIISLILRELMKRLNILVAVNVAIAPVHIARLRRCIASQSTMLH
ncbi:hypothetical protein BKA62DRAFT_308309 [Auriculariales sp. MPI-PUGE-AT-0066]|nr:hypothetical protein BKA62DRAFT_308309 [Auriculariales sp. MPI-PUGE-AT-0066]